MRHIWVVGISLAVSLGVSAQQRAGEPDDAVGVLKFGWEKVRIDWMKDPLTSPTGENFYEMRRRISTERRPRSAMEERNVSAAREEKEKPQPPPRYIFEYRVSILNNRSKAIKEIDWDYLFLDSNSSEMLGVREFTSTEKVAGGKRKELKISISAPPTSRISVHNLGKNERDGLTEKILIRRILYEDGSVWQAAHQ